MTIKTGQHLSAQRWTIRRKADVLAALAWGGLPLHTALERNDLTPAELAEWWRQCKAKGLLF